MTLSKEAQEFIALTKKQNMKALFTNQELFKKALEENRKLQQKPYQAPDFIYDELDVEIAVSPSGFETYTLQPKARESFPGCHIIYFHGGAFFLQIDQSHWSYCVRLAKECNATVSVPIYPLAPTYDFKDAYAYLLEVYRWALERTPPDKLVLMGDSAGGMFDIVAAQLASLEGLAQPRLILPFSPVLDLRPVEPEAIDPDLEERDILLSFSASDGLNEVFIKDAAYLDAFPANPMLGPLGSLAPIVLYVGGDEIFSRDALRFAKEVEKAGGEIELHIAAGMWHIFPLMQDIPESEKVNEEVFAQLRAI